MDQNYANYKVPFGFDSWEEYSAIFQQWLREEQQRGRESRGLLDDLPSNNIHSTVYQPQYDGLMNFNAFDGGENRPLADVGDKEAVIPYSNVDIDPVWSDGGNVLNQPPFDNQYRHIPSQDFSLSVPMGSQALQQSHGSQAPQDYRPLSFPQHTPAHIPELEQMQPYYANGHQPMDSLYAAQVGMPSPTNDLSFPKFHDANGQMSDMGAPSTTFPTIVPTGNYCPTQFENPMSYSGVPPATPFDPVYDPRLNYSAVPPPAPVHAAGPVFAPIPVSPLPNPLLAAQHTFVQEPLPSPPSSQHPLQHRTRAPVKRKRDEEASAEASSSGSAPHASPGDSETVDTSSSQPRKKGAKTATKKSKTVVKKAKKAVRKASSQAKKPRVSRDNDTRFEYFFDIGSGGRPRKPTQHHIWVHCLDEEKRAATTWHGEPLPDVPVCDLPNLLVKEEWTPKDKLTICGFKGCTATAKEKEEGKGKGNDKEPGQNWLRHHIRGEAHLDVRLMCLICGFSAREDNFRMTRTGIDDRHGIVCPFGEDGRVGKKRHPLFEKWDKTPELAEMRKQNAAAVRLRDTGS